VIIATVLKLELKLKWRSLFGVKIKRAAGGAPGFFYIHLFSMTCHDEIKIKIHRAYTWTGFYERTVILS
jgi:hypothetical protein